VSSPSVRRTRTGFACGGLSDGSDLIVITHDRGRRFRGSRVCGWSSV